MLILQDPLRQTDLPRGCVATIGNFDGMHIGHQAIVRGVIRRAEELKQPSAVITFHPHPISVVAPDRAPKQILTLAQKEEILRNMGVEALLVRSTMLATFREAGWEVGVEIEQPVHARPTPESELVAGVRIDGLPVAPTTATWCVLRAS